MKSEWLLIMRSDVDASWFRVPLTALAQKNSILKAAE